MLTSWDIQVLEYRKGFLVNKAMFLDNFKVNTKKNNRKSSEVGKVGGFSLIKGSLDEKLPSYEVLKMLKE